MSKEDTLKRFNLMLDTLSLEDIEIINKALTTPTQEEVCRELSKYYKEEIVYNGHNEFHFKNSYRRVNKVINDKGSLIYKIVEYLPPHLITMIGRFYEGRKEDV